MNTANTEIRSFYSPFEKGYWRCAASEFGNPRTIVVAAMITALRIVIQGVSIPIIPNVLYISLGFFANALGSMIYGPLVGLVSGAISDTVGAFLFPQGDYFFPYIITAMVSSFVFGLFLYRAKLSATRIMTARFSVVLICNIFLTPIIIRWYYAYFGIEKVYKFFTLARTIKNAALFPAETLLLSVFLFAMAPAASRMKLIPPIGEKPKLTRENIALLAALTVIAAVAVYLYYIYYIMK